MKNFFICCVIILSLGITANVKANNFATQEAMLVLMAGISAKEPQAAAAIDVLAFMAVPGAEEYQTDWERTIAYIGLGALAFYNYDAEDDGRSEEEIFNTNLIVFNIILAGHLFGSDERASNLVDVEESSSKFNLQLTPNGGPRASWQFSFD